MKVLNWENLRNSEIDEPYFLPFKKEDYLSKVEVNEPDSLTKLIIKDLEKAGLKKNIFNRVRYCISRISIKEIFRSKSGGK